MLYFHAWRLEITFDCIDDISDCRIDVALVFDVTCVVPQRRVYLVWREAWLMTYNGEVFAISNPLLDSPLLEGVGLEQESSALVVVVVPPLVWDFFLLPSRSSVVGNGFRCSRTLKCEKFT